MISKLIQRMKKGKAKQRMPMLCFNDTFAAFDYACEYFHDEIIPMQGIVSMVCSDVQVTSDGSSGYMLKVSSIDKGFFVFAAILNKRVPKMSIGDLVIWVPVTHSEDMVIDGESTDVRTGWIGFIGATINPTFTEGIGWDIKEKLA
ncbi:hypothetical protein ABN070_14915 [Morganella morganii]|uniref:hypothetical protein n=1 Tax=Morganella morganii TaxID=582 RepID=UPI0032DA975B